MNCRLQIADYRLPDLKGGPRKPGTSGWSRETGVKSDLAAASACVLECGGRDTAFAHEPMGTFNIQPSTFNIEGLTQAWKEVQENTSSSAGEGGALVRAGSRRLLRISGTRVTCPSGNGWQGCRVATRAFTLIELLTVISILGIIAALTVPALKQFGKSDASVTATQQLLRDVGRARQLALADRTTVYMVFVPASFWTNTLWTSEFPNLTASLQTASSNLCDNQLTGYTFIAQGALGDQPGQHAWHYLAPWQNLPQGTFIAPWKFYQSQSPFSFADPGGSHAFNKIYPFDYANFRFPSDTALATNFLPYIAFNYLGQLVPPDNAPSFDQDDTGSGVDIPLVKGAVMAAIDPSTKIFQFGSPQLIETPPGNGTNITFNVLHIDPLTGRATVLYHQVQ
ncbi:MAG TPA: type II secretion system protein [Verrucomicrobiae bacterium]|jgi:prepilin-type N-terminal cleavage/methylation domain-containing protein